MEFKILTLLLIAKQCTNRGRISSPWTCQLVVTCATQKIAGVLEGIIPRPNFQCYSSVSKSGEPPVCNMTHFFQCAVPELGSYSEFII